HVEALDAAGAAEAMPRGAGAETVFGEVGLAREQPEARGRHDQVQVAAHAADRAVAFERVDPRGRLDLETHASAMAAAAVDGHVADRRGSGISGKPRARAAARRPAAACAPPATRSARRTAAA